MNPRSICFCVALAVFVSACGAAGRSELDLQPAEHSAEGMNASPSVSLASPVVDSLAKVANVECAATNNGQTSCTAGRLSVDLHEDCGREALFGAVSADDGITLKEKPEADAGSVARLGGGQFLCIRGLARQEQNPEWYFVMAIPVTTVADCAGKELCRIYGDRPVAWAVQKSGKPCELKNDRYVGDCASGWVTAESIEIFSEGI